ncbi:tRNA (adenosine(37)-N6)-threonylcarbamoyltransferase complex dimerization subunit type 1 TsaB [Blattabacterium cuenoti]|uniref:tRNA (adenosine(37)-N6)-threonylcarbamoyltransferase complex dimerization subunit type 1 TsaB n=1 Tax=Blattabacterium cuenoti TaxID=1653831 RepID=UPI00163BA994|nr:tRNA (adenosine(37)-N6)-threonylcarbamoyltransferase complex dimerization subunit type 1 TsaB [Blattabacterium cuenoti]
MSLILNLETSTKNCSISIAENGKCLSYIEELSDQYFHSEKLHTFIQYVINISNINIRNIQSVCVSEGPGSYTSLRIGSSAAKGLCYSLGIPLLSIDSLTIMIQKINIKSDFFIPIIHTKSDLFYVSLFNESKKRLSSIKSVKMFSKKFLKKIKNKKVCFIANIEFFEFLHKTLYGKNFNIKNEFFYKKYPSAMDMSLISYEKFCKKKFHNIDKFIPFYL